MKRLVCAVGALVVAGFAQAQDVPPPAAWVGKLATDYAEGSTQTLFDHPYFQKAYANDARASVVGQSLDGSATTMALYGPERYQSCEWYQARGLSLEVPGTFRKQDYVFFNAYCASQRSIVAFMVPAFNLPIGNEPTDADLSVYYCLDSGKPAGADQRANTFSLSGNGYEVPKEGIRAKTVAPHFKTSLCGLDPIQDKAQHMLNEMYRPAATTSAPAAAAPAAPPAAAGPEAILDLALTDADILNFADAALSADAQAWFFNRYDAGSTSNPELQGLDVDARSVDVLADFTMNGRATGGWIRISVIGGQLSCVEFWDVAGTCRALRRPVSANALAAFNERAFSGVPPAKGREAAVEVLASSSEPPYVRDPELEAALAPYLAAETERLAQEKERITALPENERRWAEKALAYRSRIDSLGGAGLDRATFEAETDFPQKLVKNTLDTRPIEYFRSTFALNDEDFWRGAAAQETSRNSATALFNSLVNPIARPTIVAGDLRLYYASGLSRPEIEAGLAACKVPKLTNAQICDCAAAYPGEAGYGAGVGNGVVNTNQLEGAEACNAAMKEREAAGQPPSPFLMAQLNRLALWNAVTYPGRLQHVPGRTKTALDGGFARARVQKAMEAVIRFTTTGSNANYEAAVKEINEIRGLYPADAESMALMVEDVSRAARLTSGLVNVLFSPPDPAAVRNQAGRDEAEFYAIKRAEADYYKYRAPKP